ncbi:hypothetical protein EV182_005880 [Spiromyces aspiralis]|uniref:Uncharacterized protein n=1 Tax=Spiromyces aspiralis TaxID=68401 RepID=A0ACC1HQG6_9FUNG|nr:hypothetical protein EV182_005880 [Spiromyces aspiralis]
MRLYSVAALAFAAISLASPIDRANVAAVENPDADADPHAGIKDRLDLLQTTVNSITNAINAGGDIAEIDNLLTDVLNNIYILNNVFNNVLNIGILNGVNGAGSGSV